MIHCGRGDTLCAGTVPGDNNCHFHALADQLNKRNPQLPPTDALTVRSECVDWLEANANRYMEVSCAHTVSHVLDELLFLQVDHPTGENSRLRQVVEMTTAFRYEDCPQFDLRKTVIVLCGSLKLRESLIL